jgi:hypothetical protein
MSVPKELVDLLADVIAAILSSPDPKAAARRALEAARTKAIDEALKIRAPRKK